MSAVDSYLLGGTAGATELANETNAWRPLHFYSIYRLTLAGLLAFLVLTGNLSSPFGSLEPQVFYWTCLAYLVFALPAGFASRLHLFPYNLQVVTALGVDLLALTLLIHASGGINSGLGMLLLVTVAAGSLLLPNRGGIALAAAAALMLLLEQTHLVLAYPKLSANFPQSAMLGAALFATSALAHVLASRLRVSEAVAAQRGLDLANIAQLTRFALQQIPVGVVAVDAQDRVRLMNDSAWRVLGRPSPSEKNRLVQVSKALDDSLQAWRGGRRVFDPLRVGESEVLPRFVGIGTGQYAGTVVFLEDAAATARQVQQLKLAALGRLTASIAHEIRNPLGAISHSGQLLAESELGEQDRRLVEIILNHAHRVNHIIESVLQLGRRDKTRPSSVRLGPLLEELRSELLAVTGLPAESVHLEFLEPATTWFDAVHLHQIVWNLCQNAVEHAAVAQGGPRVTITASERGIEVCDNGPGVPPELLPNLFEPFVTSKQGGTGLGLFVSRELAECNQAQLEHIEHESGTCFRLSFDQSAAAVREPEEFMGEQVKHA